MKFEFTPVIDDVDMSWEVPQPATGDFAGLPVSGDPVFEKCYAAAVLTVDKRPQWEVDEDDEDNPMMDAGLYLFIADGLGYYSGAAFYRPCSSVDEAKGYLAELTLDKFLANALDPENSGYPLANQDWIKALGWTEVPI